LRLERAKVAPGAFTLEAVAARLGVSLGTYWRWELGKHRPHPRKARALAREYGVTVGDLGLEDAAEEESDGLGQ